MKQTARAKGHVLKHKRGELQTSLRMETELFERIKRAAIANRRSMAQEIVYRVVRSLDAEEAET